MSKTFETAVRHIGRLIAAAEMSHVPVERIAYAVSKVEYDQLRTEIVSLGPQDRVSSYGPTNIAIMGVPVTTL